MTNPSAARPAPASSPPPDDQEESNNHSAMPGSVQSLSAMTFFCAADVFKLVARAMGLDPDATVVRAFGDRLFARHFAMGQLEYPVSAEPLRPPPAGEEAAEAAARHRLFVPPPSTKVLQYRTRAAKFHELAALSGLGLPSNPIDADGEFDPEGSLDITAFCRDFVPRLRNFLLAGDLIDAELAMNALPNWAFQRLYERRNDVDIVTNVAMKLDKVLWRAADSLMVEVFDRHPGGGMTVCRGSQVQTA